METPNDRQPSEVGQGEGAGRRGGGDDGLRLVFFEGLASMTAIVTVITQPFAQESMRATFELPGWLPIITALGVSGLLAVYRMLRIGRQSTPWERAICVPLLACVIFSGYATGNNVIFYTMEGYTKDAKGPTAEARMAALTAERDNLKQQLEGAHGAIGALRRTLGLPASENKPSSSLSVPSRVLGFFGAGQAYAQAPGPGKETGRAAPDAAKLRQLEEVLKKFEADSRKLTDQLDRIKQDERGRATSQQPLIKSW